MPQPHTRPQPKPPHYQPTLTDAEAGDLLRRLVALDTDIRKAQATIAEKRREQETLLNQARVGVNPGIIEVCSLCSLRHEGPC